MRYSTKKTISEKKLKVSLKSNNWVSFSWGENRKIMYLWSNRDESRGGLRQDSHPGRENGANTVWQPVILFISFFLQVFIGLKWKRQSVFVCVHVCVWYCVPLSGKQQHNRFPKDTLDLDYIEVYGSSVPETKNCLLLLPTTGADCTCTHICIQYVQSFAHTVVAGRRRPRGDPAKATGQQIACHNNTVSCLVHPGYLWSDLIWAEKNYTV